MHAGHNHTPEDDAPKSSGAMRITYIGLACNIALVFAKGVAGVLGNSTAMIADAIHSVTDMLSDGVTLWAVKLSSAPKDPDHPYGHGKFDSIGTLAVSGILVATAAGIGMHAYDSIQHLTSHQPSWLALSAALVSIAVKEALFRATISIGKEERSGVIIANAWHHRSDAMSSVVALVGIAGSMLGYPILDPLSALFVAGLILKSGVSLGYDSVKELTDSALENEIIADIEAIAMQIEGVERLISTRARKMGPYTLVDMRVIVDSALSVTAAVQVTEQIQRNITKQIPRVSEVIVRLDTQESLSLSDSELTANSRAGAILSHDHDHELVVVPLQYSTSNTTSLIRPEVDILRDIHAVITMSHGITRIVRLATHPSDSRLFIRVDVAVEDDMPVKEARYAIKQVREAIKGIPGVIDARVEMRLTAGDSPGEGNKL